MSTTPEKSDFTSIQQRIEAYQNQQQLPESMCRFEDENSRTQEDIQPLPCKQFDYFELVDTTGRLIAAGKKGAIPSHLQPILERLKIKSDSWTETITNLSQSFAYFMGRPESIEKCMVILEKPKLHGLKQALSCFNKKY